MGALPPYLPKVLFCPLITHEREPTQETKREREEEQAKKEEVREDNTRKSTSRRGEIILELINPRLHEEQCKSPERA